MVNHRHLYPPVLNYGRRRFTGVGGGEFLVEKFEGLWQRRFLVQKCEGLTYRAWATVTPHGGPARPSMSSPGACPNTGQPSHAKGSGGLEYLHEWQVRKGWPISNWAEYRGPGWPGWDGGGLQRHRNLTGGYTEGAARPTRSGLQFTTHLDT